MARNEVRDLALEELFALAESDDCIGLSEAEVRFGPALNELLAGAVLVPVGAESFVICRDCTPPHPVDVSWSPLREQWGYRCADAGWQSHSKVELTRLRLAPEGLEALAARALETSTEARRVIAPAHDEPATTFRLTCLGVASSPRRWTAFLGIGLHHDETLEQAHRALSGAVGKEPGLLITTGHPPKRFPLPNRHRLAWASDVFEMDEGRLKVTVGLDRLLQGKRPRAKRGPKTLRDDAIELLRSRRRHGLNHEDLDEETRIVIARLGREHRDETLPLFKEVRHTWFKDELS
jgi:hypothetical protein